MQSRTSEGGIRMERDAIAHQRGGFSVFGLNGAFGRYTMIRMERDAIAHQRGHLAGIQ